MAAGSVGRHSPRSTPPRHGPTALPRRASADMPGSTGNSAAGWSVPRPALRGQTRKRRALFCRVARWAAAAFSPNSLLRGEYRFSYFPEASDALAFLPSTTGLNNTYRYRLSAQTHILSVGLAYKF